MEEIKCRVNTGAVKVVFDDENGDILGSVKFVPSDFGIIARFREAQTKLEKISVTEDFEGCEKVSEEIKNIIGYLVNTSVEDIFSKCNPLTTTSDGRFYFEVVVEGIGNVIMQMFDERVATRKARIDKAMEKYS